MSYITDADIQNPFSAKTEKDLLKVKDSLSVPAMFKNKLSTSLNPKYVVSNASDGSSTRFANYSNSPRLWRVVRYSNYSLALMSDPSFIHFPCFDFGVFKDYGFFAGIHFGFIDHNKIKIFKYISKNIDGYIELLNQGYILTITGKDFDSNASKNDIIEALTNPNIIADENNPNKESYCRLKIDNNLPNDDFLKQIEMVFNNKLLFDTVIDSYN